jgi:hypothetical protein
MCSSYWNLKNVGFTCPECGALTSDDLQTHFMGDVGSCSNWYVTGQTIPELAGVSVTLGRGGPDTFIGGCPECDAIIDFGAKIVNGVVVEVWPEFLGPDDPLEQRGL